MGIRNNNNTVIRITAGVVCVVLIVFLVQWLSGFFSQRFAGNGLLFNLVVAIIQCILAVWSYVLLYRFFEKRRITELGCEYFLKNAVRGFLTGLILQSLIILVLIISGGYTVTHLNPASFMLPAFTAALTAGFVAEIILRGILFRLIEERLGTIITMCLMMLLFAIMHLGGNGATILSVLAVSMQAGFLLSAGYVLTRNLWFPVFLHFAWDFAEPGVFGAINPGNSIEKNLLICRVSGPDLLTGGIHGPVNSLQSLVFCFLAGLFFLWLAWRGKNFIFPYWKKA